MRLVISTSEIVMRFSFVLVFLTLGSITGGSSLVLIFEFSAKTLAKIFALFNASHTRLLESSLIGGTLSALSLPRRFFSVE